MRKEYSQECKIQVWCCSILGPERKRKFLKGCGSCSLNVLPVYLAYFGNIRGIECHRAAAHQPDPSDAHWELQEEAGSAPVLGGCWHLPSPERLSQSSLSELRPVELKPGEQSVGPEEVWTALSAGKAQEAGPQVPLPPTSQIILSDFLSWPQVSHL